MLLVAGSLRWVEVMAVAAQPGLAFAPNSAVVAAGCCRRVFFATTFVQGCKGAQCLGTHCAVLAMSKTKSCK